MGWPDMSFQGFSDTSVLGRQGRARLSDHAVAVADLSIE
jgi:hypothetical protein